MFLSCSTKSTHSIFKVLLYSHFLNPISLLVLFLCLPPLYYPVWLHTIPPFLKDSIPLSAIVFLLSPQTTPIMSYTPLDTKALLEIFTKRDVDSYEISEKEEVRTNIQEGSQAYSNADVVVKLGGWDADYSKKVAQASLSALKSLILSDKKLPGKKGLYIRLGCGGDWPNINPPGRLGSI